MNKTKLIATSLFIPTTIGIALPIITSCATLRVKPADIDTDRKAAKTNGDGLTYYPVNLASNWDENNQLTAAITITTEKPAYQLKIESINPIEGEKKAYVVVRMVPGAGRVVQSGDSVNFDLELTCSDSTQNNVLWSNKIEGLSTIWGETAEDIDEDCDGLSAAIDLDDHDNEYIGGIASNKVKMNFQFNMDYKEIFKVALGLDGYTKNQWSDNLAKFAAVLANHGSSPTPVSIEKNRVYDCTQPSGLYSQIGCKDYEKIILNPEDYTTDENDVNAIELAHHDMVNPYDETQTFKILFYSARGTKTANEWISNLDVGAYDGVTETNYLPEGKTIDEVHPDWYNKHNVKGTDVAANRIWKKIFGENGYCAQHGINMDSDNVIVFGTGYSRGGGLANILSARIVDTYVTARPNAVYNITYCYATPFTTDKQDYGNKYDSIHCVVNQDDFIGKLPFEAWNLMKYGKIHTMPIGTVEANVKKYNEEWKLRDPEGAKEYIYYDFWLNNIETLPVQDRYDMYKVLDATETVSEAYATRDEAQAKVDENKETFDDLNISSRYISQEIQEEDEQFVIHTKVSLGAMSDIANNFFNGTLISIPKLISVLPLFESYDKYVGKLISNITFATLFGKGVLDVVNIDHSSTTYYFAAANMPQDQK